MTTRYAGWYKTEPGFETAADVQEWIDRQDNAGDYYIVATTDEFDRHPEADAEVQRGRKRELERSYIQGKAFERDRLKALLGLQ